MLPNVTTSTARIKVEAVDNYFFDVNDANFSITPLVHRPTLGDGKGKFTSPKGSSKKVQGRQGQGHVRLHVDAAPGRHRRAAPRFKFKKGKVSFAGTTVTSAVTAGDKLTVTVTGTNNGKSGYTLVIVAVDGQEGQDPGAGAEGQQGRLRLAARRPGLEGPTTRVKGHINVT